ncbi:hypothetical protein ACEZCY_06360 [Streptacidiphilus sp. N1-12]|uniref:Mce-associated membrane protein n=2 Tax=Streptacidiphilus alkalitolerans TaxID=3342712 RepID=A0ABV6W9Z1_9ACTN
MSTTRHLVNRQRRLAAAAPRRATSAALAERPRPTVPDLTDEAAEAPAARTHHLRLPRLPRVGLPLLCAVLVLLLGGFSAWAGTRADDLASAPARQNTALADSARTSEVKGQITTAVNTLFSYNYADPSATDNAARKLVVGDAVQQYAKLLAGVRQQAPAQKLVLTTTVTRSGVESLSGDRARLLLFADQRNTSTTASAQSTYGAAMLAVDAVYQGGAWRISSIDTFS